MFRFLREPKHIGAAFMSLIIFNYLIFFLYIYLIALVG